MRLKLNNEFRKVSRSSKNVNYGEIKEKNELFPKIKLDNSFIFGRNKKNSNKQFNNSPNITMNNISMNEQQNYIKSKRFKNTHLAFHNPFKKNNIFLHPNYLYLPKQSNNLNKSKLTLGDNAYNQKSRNSIRDSINQSIYERPNKNKTNLKLIQKEIQYKLLDMSIQIENESPKKENSDFLNEKNELWSKNIKNELDTTQNERKRFRRKSVNVNDINQLYNLNDINRNMSFKGLLKSKTKRIGTNNQNNINAFRNDLSNTSINTNLGNRRKSVVLNNHMNLNKFVNNINSINMSFNNNNKSMFYKNNISFINKNNISFNMNNNNKSMYINRNNISVNKMILTSVQNKEYENKYRVIMRHKELYDSLEDEEIIEQLEEEYVFISPETHRIFIFDTFLLFCILFCCFYYPLHIAQSICFCSYIPLWVRVILFFTDFMNIFDIVISFFRAYYNFEFVLIKKNDKIVINYLKKYFFSDLISAIPIFTISFFLCKIYQPDGPICFVNGIDIKYNFLKISLGLKIIKIFKVLDKKRNRGINYFYEKISENYTLEKVMKMMLFGLMCIMGFNVFICYHIFIGRQNYPNWIIATHNQDKSFLNLYLISLYFLITTITSVGYGDITCVSLGETVFQIILLTIGVIAYSWVISTIGNYVKKETRAAIKYNKDKELLEEIRISYPKMSFRLYNKIYKHLETVSHQQEKFDTNLLVNNLPYTLKNKLMFIIYEKIIKKFIFFKECENSDFILRVLTSFIPLTAKKGAFIIHEGELVDNIIFVKEGRLCLVAAIDLDNPLISIDNYLGEKFEDINEKMETKLDNSINKSTNIGLKIEKAQTEIRSFLKTRNELNNSNIELEIAKCDFNGDEDDFDIGNHQFLNVLDILKNEHYGEVYMFLQKPSPLSLRVKTKYSELFLLRKHEAMIISRAYPNVWKKIYYKSYHNMKSIKKITKKIIIHYCQNYGHKYDSKKGSDILRHDSDNNFVVNLGLLNDKQKERKKRIKFDLERRSNKNLNTNMDNNLYPKKKILKNRYNNQDNYNPEDGNPNMNQNGFLKNNGFLIQVNGKQMNPMNQFPMNKMKTLNTNLTHNNNIFRVSSKDKFSKTIAAKIPALKQVYKNRNKNYNESKFNNKISNTNINNNNINNISKNTNIIINNEEDSKTIDLNSTSKMLSNLEDNTRIKTIITINTYNNSPFKKMNSNVAVTSKSIYFKTKDKNDSNCISSLSFKPKISGSINTKPLEKLKSLQIINDTNINDTKIIQESNKNTMLTQRVEEPNEIIEKTPNTINNLSRPLIKKIQKKIKKRRKKKQLYKMLLGKITESLVRINPNSNINLNSSINNSLNNSRNDNNNFQFGSYIGVQDNNSLNSDKLEYIEGINNQINGLNGQELLIIPESPEFDSLSSSDNSKSSSGTQTISIKEKKKIELSISENYNFSYSSKYDNLDSISEGNYSKDTNLQKSVMKLIKVYLNEKMKSKNNRLSFDKNDFSDTTIKKEKEKEKEKENKNAVNKKSTKKEKEKEKNKEIKNEEEDVWAFLNEEEHNEHENINFNLDSSSSSKKSSVLEEKNYSKTPKGKIKKNIDFTGAAKAKSRFRKNNSNIFGDKDLVTESFSPKSKKKKDITKKRTKKGGDLLKLKKCTTIIHHKKTKKKVAKNNKYKSNKNAQIENNLNKITNSNNNDTILSSLDLTINDNFEQQDTYLKHLYKTYNKKEKGEDDKNSSKLDDNSINILKDK